MELLTSDLLGGRGQLPHWSPWWQRNYCSQLLSTPHRAARGRRSGPLHTQAAPGARAARTATVKLKMPPSRQEDARTPRPECGPVRSPVRRQGQQQRHRTGRSDHSARTCKVGTPKAQEVTPMGLTAGAPQNTLGGTDRHVATALLSPRLWRIDGCDPDGTTQRQTAESSRLKKSTPGPAALTAQEDDRRNRNSRHTPGNRFSRGAGGGKCLPRMKRTATQSSMHRAKSFRNKGRESHPRTLNSDRIGSVTPDARGDPGRKQHPPRGWATRSRGTGPSHLSVRAAAATQRPGPGR